MKVIYIAGPYRAETAWDIEQNIRQAEVAGLSVAAMGATPLIPHTMTRFFQGTISDDYWLGATLELLRRCDAVLLLPGWEDSSGSRGEREEALDRGLPCFTAFGDLQEWLAS